MNERRMKKLALSLIAGFVFLVITMVAQNHSSPEATCPPDTYDSGVCLTVTPAAVHGGFPLSINGVDFYPAAIFAIDLLFFSALVYLFLTAFDKRHSVLKLKH